MRKSLQYAVCSHSWDEVSADAASYENCADTAVERCDGQLNTALAVEDERASSAALHNAAVVFLLRRVAASCGAALDTAAATLIAWQAAGGVVPFVDVDTADESEPSGGRCSADDATSTRALFGDFGAERTGAAAQAQVCVQLSIVTFAWLQLGEFASDGCGPPPFSYPVFIFSCPVWSCAELQQRGGGGAGGGVDGCRRPRCLRRRVYSRKDCGCSERKCGRRHRCQ